ncbi:MAG: thiol oxidoreductase, partial [Bdellovibrionales bacterium]
MTRGARDERGRFPTLEEITNSRATTGLFGSGYIEMLARQMTTDLQKIRDAIAPGQSQRLVSKNVDFGVLKRGSAGHWDVSGVEGISEASLTTEGPDNPPSLVIRPFHQASTVISLREFTNNAFNHHHGMQSTERFGANTDPDGDGVKNEMTRADITAASVFQATLPVPGRVIPRDSKIRTAIRNGERKFAQVRCDSCHRSSLPLENNAWVFTEPNPFNPPKNLRPGDAPDFRVDLNSPHLPQPRLKAVNGVVHVPAFTDFKLHDITNGPGDPNCDPINMNHPAGSDGF